MNKENIVKNISLLSRKKSPTPHKINPSQSSFRNINSKSFYKHNHTEMSTSPLSSKRIKTNPFRDHSTILHTEVSDSMMSNHNNSLAEAFKMERESLVNTLKMYKEQLEVTNHEQAKTKKQLNKMKSMLKDKEDSIVEHVKKNVQLSRKVFEYENMLPKLIQLEQLQQKIIGQNNGLKNRIKMQEAILNNVANIAKYEQPKSPALEKIHGLTQTYLKESKKHK